MDVHRQVGAKLFLGRVRLRYAECHEVGAGWLVVGGLCGHDVGLSSIGG